MLDLELMNLSELSTLSRNGVPEKYSYCSVCFDELLILCFDELLILCFMAGSGNAGASLIGQVTLQTDSEVITQ